MIDPMFRANMPDSYNTPLNYGIAAGSPESVGWNINSSYLTPTFMAGYRPNYGGPHNMQMPNMGFWRGANNAMPTLWQPDSPYYMDSRQYRSHAEYSSGSTAMDLAATGAQFATGILTAAAISNVLTPSGIGNMIKGNSALGFAGGQLGRGAGAAMGLATRGAGLAARGLLGASVGGAIQGGLGTAAGMMAGAGGMAGAFAGGVIAPFAIGLGVAEMGNQAFFRPFMAGRQGADTLREYYSNSALGMGTASNPLGMSPTAANRIGFDLSASFSKRLDFKPESGAQILQFGLQEGLYKNIGSLNSDSVVKRTNEIANQIKMVMKVFNEPSMQEAVKMIGQMAHAGGISGSVGVAGLTQSYAAASSLTGMSSRQLMGTVGMQGQMMFGQAGLMPGLGQAAALNAITGVSAAHKAGLISNATLAMMGGIEGATQSSMQGQLGLANSNYNKVMAFNQYVLGGNGGGGMMGNLSKFGNFLAGSNPMQAYGDFLLNGQSAVSAQMANNPSAIMRTLTDQMDVLGLKSGGKYDVRSAAAVASGMGMDMQSFAGMMREMQGSNAPGFRKKFIEQMKASGVSRMEGILEQENLLYDVAPVRAYRGFRKGFGQVQAGSAAAWNDFLVSPVMSLIETTGEGIFNMSSVAAPTNAAQISAGRSVDEFIAKKTSKTMYGSRTLKWATAGTYSTAWLRKEDERNVLKAQAVADNNGQAKAFLAKVKNGGRASLSAAEVYSASKMFEMSEDQVLRMADSYGSALITDGKGVTSTTSEADKLVSSARGALLGQIDGADYLGDGRGSTKTAFKQAAGQFGGLEQSSLAAFAFSLTGEESSGQILDMINQSGNSRVKEILKGNKFFAAAFGTGTNSRARAESVKNLMQTFMGTINSNPEMLALAMSGSTSSLDSERSLMEKVRGNLGASAAAGGRFKGKNISNMGFSQSGAASASLKAELQRYGKMQDSVEMAKQFDFSGFLNIMAEDNKKSADVQLKAAQLQYAAALMSQEDMNRDDARIASKAEAESGA